MIDSALTKPKAQIQQESKAQSESYERAMAELSHSLQEAQDGISDLLGGSFTSGSRCLIPVVNVHIRNANILLLYGPCLKLQERVMASCAELSP